MFYSILIGKRKTEPSQSTITLNMNGVQVEIRTLHPLLSFSASIVLRVRVAGNLDTLQDSHNSFLALLQVFGLPKDYST